MKPNLTEYPTAILAKLLKTRLPVTLRPLIVEKIRRNIRKSFLDFCEYALADQNKTPAAHHRLLISKLEAVARGEITRLMIWMPPGSAKSYYTSQLFPVWLMMNKGKTAELNEGIKIIGCSHTADLAESFSKRIQKTIRELSDFTDYNLENEAAHLWQTTNGCEYKCAGVGGPITGFRSDIGIIDDPVRSRSDAESPTFRKKTKEWFDSDFLTRTKPGAPIIVIQTRWNEGDLSGQLIKEQPGDWEILKLPAIAGRYDDKLHEWTEGPEPDPLGREPGEFLWSDDEYGYADDIRNKMNRAGARDYWSLYMQEPKALTGGIFKKDQINIVDALPAGRWKFVRAWDLASTKENGSNDPDATAGALLGVDQDGRFCLADMVHFKGGPDDVERTIIATGGRDTRLVPVSLPIDPGQAGKAQVLYLTRKLAGHKVYSSPETGDKATRAAPLAAQINIGNLLLVRGEWNSIFLDELESFPGGKHDDTIDATSRAFNHLISGIATERFEALAS